MTRAGYIISVYIFLVYTSFGDDIHSRASVAGTNSVSSILEEQLSELTNKVFLANCFGLDDYSKFEILIRQSCSKKLEGKGALEKENVIRSYLGVDGYKSLERVLLNQLSFADRQLRVAALRGLGEMYSTSSKDFLIDSVFNENPYVQFSALVSLVKIDAEGSDKLLMNALLAGTLPNPMASVAIDALVSTNIKMVSDLALDIAARYEENVVLRALLPAIKYRNDHREIIASLFLRTSAHAASGEKMNLEQLVANNLERDLLRIISADYKYYIKNAEIVRKLEKYALGDNENLYVPALLIIEKSGVKSKDYFIGLLEASDINENKRHFLRVIIERN